RIQILDVLCQSASCITESDYIRIGELRCELGIDTKPVGNPLELSCAGNHLMSRILGIDFLALQFDLGQIPLCPFANLSVDAGKLAVKDINGLLQMSDVFRRASAVENLDLGSNLLDRVLELLQA